MTKPWWENDPERFAFELSELERCNIKYRIDEVAKAQGVLRLELFVPWDGDVLRLSVIFPELYPYFRFQVFAPDLALGHHQNPISKNLCLIGRSTYHWFTEDTVAGLLTKQLKNLIATGQTTDAAAARGLEQDQAEPFSNYYPYRASMIVVPGDCHVPMNESTGTFTVARLGIQGPPPTHYVRGLIRTLSDSQDRVLYESKFAPVGVNPDSDIKGMWIRFGSPIPFADSQFLEEVFRAHPTAKASRQTRVEGGFVQLWGVVFPEEVQRREFADGWVFIYVFSERRDQLPNMAQGTGSSLLARQPR